MDNFTDLVGLNTTGSNSTVKLAELLGLEAVENYGSENTLGPVFIKRIK